MEERIQKVLSAQGFCSRREADKLLADILLRSQGHVFFPQRVKNLFHTTNITNLYVKWSDVFLLEDWIKGVNFEVWHRR